MNTQKELENKLVEAFGENVALAITNARLGSKGYCTKIQTTGLPFEINSYSETVEESEQKAIQEFEKQMAVAFKEKLFATQPIHYYKEMKLYKNNLDKLYRFTDILNEKILKEIKSKTNAIVCKISNHYECVISSPYMNMHSRGIGQTKEIALQSAIINGWDILNPIPIQIGRWPIN